jgi:hypothetical protein
LLATNIGHLFISVPLGFCLLFYFVAEILIQDHEALCLEWGRSKDRVAWLPDSEVTPIVKCVSVEVAKFKCLSVHFPFTA